MAERVGKYTVVFNCPPSIIGSAGVVGKTEGEGPLSKEFDYVFPDDTLGEASFEKSESAIQREAIIRAFNKAKLSMSKADYIFAGDCSINASPPHSGCGNWVFRFWAFSGHAQLCRSRLGLRPFSLTPAQAIYRLRQRRRISAPPKGSSGSRWNTAVNVLQQPSAPLPARAQA